MANRLVSPKQRVFRLRHTVAWGALLVFPMAAADLESAAQSAPALLKASPASVAELRKKIEADNPNNPVASVHWGEAALQLLGPDHDPELESWFLSRLVHDLNTLDKYAQATQYLGRARKAVAATRNERAHLLLEV